MSELYKKLRPTKFSQVVGQTAIVNALEKDVKAGKTPHFILLTGPSGTGKTTLARIVAKSLRCGKNDLEEINCANFRGVDTVRDFQRRMGMAPLSGPVRVFIVDECHQLTKDAQNAFLKILEDTPPHVYFMLAATEPEKLLRTMHTRGSHYKLTLLKDAEMETLVNRTLVQEKSELSEEVIEKIVKVSEGSPRKALVFIDQILGLDDDEQRLELLSADSSTPEVIELCREVMKAKPSWPKLQGLLREFKEEPESIRRAVLGYAAAIMSNSKNQKQAARAYIVIDSFRANYYDTGKAGLYASCYESVFGIG